MKAGGKKRASAKKAGGGKKVASAKKRAGTKKAVAKKGAGAKKVKKALVAPKAVRKLARAAKPRVKKVGKAIAKQATRAAPRKPAKARPPLMKTKEILISQLDPAKWTLVTAGGFRIYKLWEHPETGASIALFQIPKGGGVPSRHVHASNQFMYCLAGEYEYLSTGLVLKPGSFYMNPKGHPHGPTIARKDSLLIEMYDGPHYFERPSYHTAGTVGRIAGAPAKAATRRKA